MSAAADAETARVVSASRGCPLCAGACRLWTHHGGRELLRCGSCDFAWVPQGLARTGDGASIYEAETPFFMTTYADYYFDEGAVDAARDKVEWIAPFVPAGSRVLDVGANTGQFVRLAADRFRATGIEPSAAAVEWGTRHLGANIQVGSIDEDVARFVGEWDAVTLFDVIEHLPDPRAALERCRRYLTPEGHLFLTTPDSGSPVAKMLGRNWYYVDLIQHVSLFNRRNLTALLADAGFAVVSAKTMSHRYRFSYITTRLRELGGGNALLKGVSIAAAPLRLWPSAHVSLNFGDVMGLVARKA